MDWPRIFESAPVATAMLIIVGAILRWIAPRVDRLVDCLIAFIAKTGDLQTETHKLVEDHSGKLDAIHVDVRVVKDGVTTLLKHRPTEGTA